MNSKTTSLRDVRTRAEAVGLPGIHVGRVDGRHLQVLARILNARSAVEIGTLGGYSGVCLLRGMADDGRLDSFEVDPHHAAFARETFERAGMADRVRIHEGAAAERLADIESSAPFDLVFIDADKASYPIYVDWAARHLRPGGLVIADNAFLFGELLGAVDEATEDDVVAMQSVHRLFAKGEPFLSTVLPTGEGLAVGVRR